MAAEPIRDKKDVKKLVQYYLDLQNWRNYVLIVMGINTALRISDLLQVKWNDVYDFERKKFRTHLKLREMKTKKAQSIMLNKSILAALRLYMENSNATSGSFLFVSNRRSKDGTYNPISRQQAYRIIKEAAQKSRTAEQVSCHSLRKTFGYHAWHAGAHVVVLMEIYNHSSYAMTRRYLGIAQDERDAVYKMANWN